MYIPDQKAIFQRLECQQVEILRFGMPKRRSFKARGAKKFIFQGLRYQKVENSRFVVPKGDISRVGVIKIRNFMVWDAKR